LCAYDNNCDFATFKVLLVLDVFISRQQNVKACGFGCVEKIAVLKFAPTFMGGSGNCVAGKKRSYRNGVP
jgi:hypothetical protein